MGDSIFEASAARALPPDAPGLVGRMRAGDRRALARAISLVENGDDRGGAIVRTLYPDTGRAATIGVTGAPGVGKSSLIGALIHSMPDPDRSVGVISVDPSSPFSHGALLGDRIRLSDLFLDENVFIRSMGTRGHLGGVAEATLQVALLLDAYGKRELMIETVGVGQSEVEIARLVDTVLLVLMPGSGDSVQALKAGIMEIPDIVVVNKADLPGARELHNQVRSILMLDAGREWMPPVVEVQSVGGDGMNALWERISSHRAYLAEGGRLAARRGANLEREIFALAASRARARLEGRVAGSPRLAELFDAVTRRELDPLSCVNQLIAEVFAS